MLALPYTLENVYIYTLATRHLGDFHNLGVPRVQPSRPFIHDMN